MTDTKITDALDESLRYAEGDKTAGRETVVIVPKTKVMEIITREIWGENTEETRSFAADLTAALAKHGLQIRPIEPTPEMVEAAMRRDRPWVARVKNVLAVDYKTMNAAYKEN